MAYYYSTPERETSEHQLPDIEVFYAVAGELGTDDDGDEYAAGWYYWWCMPGCMPDSEAYGPYGTEQAALADAQENYSL